MSWFEKAQALRPPGDDDALLRWNACARLMMRYPAAATLLQRAIELDPNFALAYARLASLNANNQQSEARLENSAKAYALRERVTDRERLYIEFLYYMARGETEEASQAYELWKSTYPNDAPKRYSRLLFMPTRCQKTGCNCAGPASAYHSHPLPMKRQSRKIEWL